MTNVAPLLKMTLKRIWTNAAVVDIGLGKITKWLTRSPCQADNVMAIQSEYQAVSREENGTSSYFFGLIISMS